MASRCRTRAVKILENVNLILASKFQNFWEYLRKILGCYLTLILVLEPIHCPHSQLEFQEFSRITWEPSKTLKAVFSKGCRNREGTWTRLPWHILSQGYGNRGHLNMFPSTIFFGKIFCCNLSIFSSQLNGSSAPLTFDTFLWPCFIAITYEPSFEISRVFSKLLPSFSPQTLRIFEFILILVLELWENSRVTLANSWTQMLLSFSKNLEVREWEWESSRFWGLIDRSSLHH